jgi:hypothetical protein
MPKLHKLYSNNKKVGIPPVRDRKRGSKPSTKSIPKQPIRGKNRKPSDRIWGGV